MAEPIRAGQPVPVVPISRMQQIRRAIADLLTWLGALGVAVNLYGPAVLQLAPNIKWLPAALAIIGLGAKVWQKAQDVKNVTDVNMTKGGGNG